MKYKKEIHNEIDQDVLPSKDKNLVVMNGLSSKIDEFELRLNYQFELLTTVLSSQIDVLREEQKTNCIQPALS